MTTRRRPYRVVAITDRRDAHLPFVERHLEAPLIIVDPQEIIEGKSLTITSSNGKSQVVYGGEPLSDISGVWFRKPQPVDNIPVAEAYKGYAASAIRRLADSLYVAFEDAVWVSDYYRVLRAENKALQMRMAQHMGFAVPDTILSSSASDVRDFLHTHPVSVTKPLATVYPAMNGRTQLFFTTLLKDGFVPDVSQLHLAPAIFQQAVSSGLDVRVIVVGSDIFPASIHPKEPYDDQDSAILDYRLRNYTGGLIVRQHPQFPAELATRCVAFTKALGLRFGAFDFVRDDKGQYWFLEDNPNGQWAFVEQAAKYPIGKELARLLQNQ